MRFLSSNKNQGNSLWQFFLLTFTLSWLIWIPVAASNRELSQSGKGVVSLSLLMIGAFSPSIIGILLHHRNTEQASRTDFWRRIIKFRRITPKWYVVILLIFPTIMALTFFVETILGGEIPSLEGVIQILTNPISLLVFIISMLIGGPLAEELGWRGYALDHMLARQTALRASLVLGGIHAAWHLPLFFTKGTSQESMGFVTPLFCLWVIQVVAGSVIYTWVYNNNNNSILSAILIHFMLNSTATIITQVGNALPIRMEIIRTIFMVVLVAIIVRFWGSKTLIRID